MADADSPNSSPEGRSIGRFRILGLLGRGGMGEVYRAEDPRLGRIVALKLLPEALSDDPDAKARLLAEARAAARLDHPNIGTVYEVGEAEGGRLFLAMACYDGQTLAERLAERGPLPVDEAVALVRQLASGLAAAHRAAIVHRDLKPSNVFLCADGDGLAPRAKILDFGVAKVAGVDLTQPGSTVGTVAYSAPEQLRCEPVDGRTDLWALGVLLYEMLAGARPFTAPYPAALPHAIQSDDPAPLRKQRPDVPDALEAVVLRLLEKVPADRSPTAEAVDASLAAVLESDAPVHRPLRRRSRKAALWSAGGVLALLLVLAFVLRGMFGPRALALPEERGIAVLPFTVVDGSAGSPVSTTGLVEMIAGELTQLERYQDALWVASTSEVRSQEIDSPGEAGRALGVALAVTGTIEQDSARVLLRLHLEDAERSRRLRSKTIEVPRTDLSALQGTALAALAQMLDVELQPDARRASAARGTENALAFGAYIEGIGLLEGDALEALDQAIARFEQAVAEDPGFALAHAELGEAYLVRYRRTHEAAWVSRAEEAVQQAITLNPEEAGGYVARAQLYTTTGRCPEAVEEARRALALAPDSYRAYFALASAYEGAEEAAAAEGSYRQVVARKPGYWYGYYRLGFFYYNQGRYEEALQVLAYVHTLAPDNADGYNLLGAVYYDLGRSGEARQAWERAVALRPDDSIFSNLATLAWDEGRYADAAAMYRRALALDDQDHAVWGNLAGAYEQIPDAQAQAEWAYREALRRAEADRLVNAHDAYLLTSLGTYYVALGDTAPAREYVAQAAALEPQDAETSYYLCVAYERLGEREEALRWIERAFEAGETPEYVEGTPILASLVRDPRYTALVSQLPDR